MTKSTKPRLVSDESPKTLRDNIKSIIKERGISQAALSRESGINQGRVSAWISGTYKGDNRKTEQAMERWLRLLRAKEESQRAFDLQVHVSDLTNTRILTKGMRFAQTAADMVLFYGGAGGGKTHAIRHYQNQYSNVYVVTAEPALCSLSAVLRAVARAIDVLEGTCSAMSSAIVAKLAGRGALLVVDEAHHLSQRSMDQLRCIYDAVNARTNDFGLVWIGNEPLFSQMTTGKAMKQLLSRMGVCAPLPIPPETDGIQLLEAIVKGKLTSDGEVFAGQLVRSIGGYRSVIKAVRRAVLHTKKPLIEITESDVLAANPR